jgi:hypothetical protein
MPDAAKREAPAPPAGGCGIRWWQYSLDASSNFLEKLQLPLAAAKLVMQS